MAVQREILRRFRHARRPQQTAGQPPVRKVGQLLAAASRRTQERKRVAAEKRARDEARRRKEAAKARQKHLDALASREAQAWQEVDALIATRQPKRYDEAVLLLRDLRDLADRGGKTAEAASRLSALRTSHSGKPSLIRRLNEAGL